MPSMLQELRQIRFKNFQEELHYLCLQQDLGRDAAAIVFHTADLKAAVRGLWRSRLSLLTYGCGTSRATAQPGCYPP